MFRLFDIILTFQVCGARVKTRDTLKQHRKKLHGLLTPVPKNAQISEDVLRTTSETPGVIMSGSGQVQQHQVVGVNMEDGQQRHLVAQIPSINTVSALDQRTIIGTISNVQTIIPKM